MITDRKIDVLSTGELSHELVERAATAGVSIAVIPFIKIEAITDTRVKEDIDRITSTNATVVFTSRNAVEAVITILDNRIPDWTVFSIEGSTSEFAAEHFGNDRVIEGGFDGRSLAGTIIQRSKEKEVFFFCGDQRRDELPDLLRSKGIAVHEIIVYRNVPTPQRIDRDLDAIMFFSPSAVKSFFSMNEWKEGTIAFVIGSTTATAVVGKASSVIVADRPSREVMIDEVIAHFNTVVRSK